MCEQTEVNYLDGEVVWVKLGSCFWPGEVVSLEKLPPDVLPSFRKPPIAVVKFFQEDTYEYVKNINAIHKYECSRKNEFINKGLHLYRTKHGPMEKFPEDVIRAETAVGGDIEILTRDEFQETSRKKSYAGLFGDTGQKTSSKKGKGSIEKSSESPSVNTPLRRIKEKTDYKVIILVQGSKSTPNESDQSENPPTPSTSGVEKEPKSENEPTEQEIPKPERTMLSTPTTSTSGNYSCHACSFTTTRLNVLILHNKTHSASFTPYTPSPVRKLITNKLVKSPSKTPKARQPRKEKTDKPAKKTQGKKRTAEDTNDVVKKPKTDEEIKSSLLADWDDGDEESNDESVVLPMAASPEIPAAAKSPAVPTASAGELASAQIPGELSELAEKSNSSPSSEKPESSSDSKYEFCEDEDWPVEADIGRKIPRVKNPKRKEESTKSVSLDEDDVAKEVAELLNKTSVPELPSVPEPLKVEENFPEPSIVKSPDKNREKTPEKVSDKTITETQPTKAIFKTKTFFRSRHSRSQDAIGKYVAEQLNAVERMDIADSEINGSEIVSSPEARESPPIEQVKVARLAPKIQLKKMKAEAAQQREKERLEQLGETQDFDQFNVHSLSLQDYKMDTISTYKDVNKDQKEHVKTLQGVLYPTQEIKPVNTENNDEISKPSPISAEDAQLAPLENVDKITEEEDNIRETQNDIEKTNAFVEDILEATTVIVDKNENHQEKQLEVIHDIVSKSDELPIPVLKFPDTTLQKHYEESIEPFMNESTASAVDALLSVSREADRVTRVISVDPPEDLFEDDNKEISITSTNDVVSCENIDKSPKTEIESNVVERNVIEQNEVMGDVNSFIEPIKDSSQDSLKEPLPLLVDEPDIQKQEDIPILSIPEKTEMELNNDNEPTIQTNMNVENVPSESDLQIAEALINLPSTAIQNSNDHFENIMSSVVKENIEIENKLEDQDKIEHNCEKIEEKALQSKVEVADTTSITSENVANVADSFLISNNDSVKARFETEKEKSENLNAAQSLVEMSECIDHKINVAETNPINNNKDLLDTPVSPTFNIKQNNGIDSISTVEQKIASLSSENNSETTNCNDIKYETSSSKLLKILEEPCLPKIGPNKPKQIIMSPKEKILNFDVAKSSFKCKQQSPKQKIIIRRTTPSKSIINNISEITTPDKIILSRSNHPSQDGSSVQTYTIQSAPEPSQDKNPIIIQPKKKIITKQPSKIQKIKPQNSIIAPINEIKTHNETQNSVESMFDISSMPVVLSEDLITPESIEKMPIVMSDGNIITNTQHPPKLVKAKHTAVEKEKVIISATSNKSEVKTLLMNPITEVSKATSSAPNILSKSAKLRGAKPMLVIDKTTGKQKIIMTKADTPIKEVKQTPPTLIQSVPQTNKAEKLLILPTASSPRPGRAQKIVIDPQTGKAHVLVAKGAAATPVNANESKPVSAKLISSSDTNTPGNTVMIITNAQGTQSRILLTPEHEKILFPNKQQPNISQLKQITHRIATNTGLVQKTVVTSVTQVKAQTTAPIKMQAATTIRPQLTAPIKTQSVLPAKTQTRIVPKQKGAIITSKGQLIVGGRVATTAQNIAPMPEIRPMPKRIVASEPKKLVQTIQKTTSEPLIFLQQKSGAVMQLTAAQFEHLQRTGQIVQKSSTSIQENKSMVQKTIISPSERTAPTNPKARIRKTIMESSTPAKKTKQEASGTPAHASLVGLGAPVPALTTFATTPAPAVPSVSNTVSVATTDAYPEFDNFEELLPSTAIARQQEPAPGLAPLSEPAPAPPTSLSDSQLLAVPGEHFGGPPGSFFLCVEDNGTLTPIDNRPLVLENHQLVPMAIEPAPVLSQQPERRDILEAALANSDVFHAEPTRSEAPDFRDLNANVSVHCRVSETSTTLNQPIMTPVEVPTKVDGEPAVPVNLEAGLAVIGVTPHTVPTSLELPITVTDPRIAPKTTDPLSGTNYGPALLPSPNTELSLVSSEGEVSCVGPISMPLLTEEEVVGGKSMPILTEEAGDRGGSPSPPPAPRLLTPCSDTSEASAEIPLQPPIQFSVTELARHA
ncbi:hypothetical protein K1T71_009212 [Dendrolimus kikuchii]|uniref:Uncharacterized protein n=1 Tax=Dendrolimus kikuchii TaxID=765133 RepID=A0ACC1CU40_9NEOP|nr:hypothetical protein K1T71_009212 [Dendrolimus kikuchii]